MGGRSSGASRGLLDALVRTKKEHFESFGHGYTALQKSTNWFSEHSNSDNWEGELEHEELSSLKYYTGSGYIGINKAMYTQQWKDVDTKLKSRIEAMERGLGKSVIYDGMTVTRACDFKIFGAKSGHDMTIDQIKNWLAKHSKNGVIENKGFLSAGANDHGADIDGSGLVIHIKVPPSKGAGAYVNPISVHSGSSENEFLFNSHGLYKFDVNSLRIGSDGNIHIDGRWVGRKTRR